ncbi:UV-damage endonuclease [Exophiala xenobiotica]|nr:UV-damage endonuclease [Exophiala xenobiotica]
MAKRKRSSLPDADITVLTPKTLPVNVASVDSNMMPPQPVRRTSSRRASTQVPPADIDTNPVTNDKIKDGKDALRASPDAEEPSAGRKKRKTAAIKVKKEAEDVEVEEPATPIKKAVKQDDADREDPEAEGEEDADPEELKEALSRPPPVNSSYLPLPWKGRIGYACLNTYLRASNPPVFTSRTCRIASILEHRHPLKDPTQPEHATKNRPDKDQPADIARGQAYVEALGLANARDIPKMLRWNDRLAPFASEALAEAGSVAAELGHRLTTHPGQFTQLGSPRKEVITASIRDLAYHCELLDLLKLPEQQDRDAVMILHMGGVFGDKAATIERFKENYHKLPQKVKDRLVLENDDVCYSVHDLLPVCEELNIPLVLDYHHHNIVFDADKIREGTLDIIDLYPRIKATWTKKGITQKMHYSEPTPSAITGRQRRKHNPRVATLPPCAADMDLMIEAKDKEQAVFELMRTFKLPGFDTFNDIVPYTRNDENKPWKAPKKPKKAPKKKKSKAAEEEAEDEVEDAESEAQPPPVIPDEEVGMGGPEGRVYWPPGMEEWLRPKKREVKPRDPEKAKTTAERAAARRAEKAAWQAAQEAGNAAAVTDTPASASASASASEIADGDPGLSLEKTKSVYNVAKPKKPARAPPSGGKKKSAKSVPTPSESELSELSEEGTEQDVDMSDLTDAEEIAAPVAKGKRSAPTRATNGRSVKRKAVNYAEGDED